MPSFPLDASVSTLFQYGQVVVGILILTETALPIVGGTLFAAVGYCAVRYGLVVTVDATPVLAVAVAYLTMPTVVAERPLMIRLSQLTVMRVIIGISFLLLGVMKVVNPELVIGVADQQPSVMADPMIRLFYIGTDPGHPREWWAFGFAMSEILTGVILALGWFQRVMTLVVAGVFTKLMVLDFGWPEIPHLYPISVLLIICFSRPTHAQSGQRRRRHENVTALAG